MKLKFPILLLSLFALVTLGAAQDTQRDQPSAKSQERIIKEVRHELLMLPYFGVFDNIAFKVDGYNVTLLGQVVRPSLKSDAENVVKHIEGVEKVDNQIEVLPPSPMDDRIRQRLFRAIYQYSPLQKYELGVQKPIRIIVMNGPGSGPDIVSRVIGIRLTEAWGQQIVIDNRAGANGIIGAEIGARAAPDGYTLLMVTSQAAIVDAMYEKLNYDLVKDFSPISLLAST